MLDFHTPSETARALELDHEGSFGHFHVKNLKMIQHNSCNLF